MILRRIILLSALLAMFAVPALAYEAGTAGLLFLRLGVGERAAGMGEAYTAVAGDATAIYWNPAGLASLDHTQLHLMHNEWMQSVRVEFAGLAHPTPAGTFSVGLTALNMDEIELREDLPSSEPLGHFSPFDLAFHLGWGRSLPGRVQAGMAVKWVYSRLYEESASGWLMDLGLRHDSAIPGLAMAVALQHFGPSFQYLSESFDAPRTIRFGLAWEKPNLPGDSGLTLAWDLLLLSDGDVSSSDEIGQAKALNARNHFGIEYDWKGLAALRAGYKAGYDSQGLTCGAGTSLGAYDLDYAFHAVSNGLGSAHRFGLSLNF